METSILDSLVEPKKQCIRCLRCPLCVCFQKSSRLVLCGSQWITYWFPCLRGSCFLVVVQEDTKGCVWVLFNGCMFGAGETFAQQPSGLYKATQCICSSFSKCIQSLGLSSWGCVAKPRCARKVFTEPLQVQGKLISLYLFGFWSLPEKDEHCMPYWFLYHFSQTMPALCFPCQKRI